MFLSKRNHIYYLWYEDDEIKHHDLTPAGTWTWWRGKGAEPGAMRWGENFDDASRGPMGFLCGAFFCYRWLGITHIAISSERWGNA